MVWQVTDPVSRLAQRKTVLKVDTSRSYAGIVIGRRRSSISNNNNSIIASSSAAAATTTTTTTAMSAPHSDWCLDCKVYVGGLGADADKQALEKAFRRYGIITNFWVARNPPGFAFVEYEHPSDAEDAIRGLNGKVFEGRRLRVEMSTGKSRREVKPWYKTKDDEAIYRSRSRTRSRSSSRYSSGSSRSSSRDRSRRRSRSFIYGYRRRHYSSSSGSSTRSVRRSRTPSARSKRRRRYSSSGSYCSNSPGRSVSPRRSRSRKRSRSSTEELNQIRSKAKRTWSDYSSRSRSASRARDMSVSRDYGDNDNRNGDLAGTKRMEEDNEYDGNGGRNTHSVGVQTDYFLLLYFLEKAPEIVSETFLRVDRDKVLNSSNLPEIIPTVYQRPYSGMRRSRTSVGTHANPEKRKDKQTPTIKSPAKSKTTSEDSTRRTEEETETIDRQNVEGSKSAIAKNGINKPSVRIDSDDKKFGQEYVKELQLSKTGKPDGDRAGSLSPGQTKLTLPSEEVALSKPDRETRLDMLGDCQDDSNRENKENEKLNQEIDDTDGQLQAEKLDRNDDVLECLKEGKQPQFERSADNSDDTKTTDRRTCDFDRKELIKFQVRRRMATTLSESKAMGHGKNNQSKFDRLREKSDSSSDDDYSSDSASSRKKAKSVDETKTTTASPSNNNGCEQDD